jgi:hypothetical protein
MSDVNIAEELRHRHRLVRAGFTAQGTSFQAWCKHEGVTRQNADKALLQQWKGPKSSELVARILEAAKVAA